MIDWYYHAPGEGRVGPFSADELRKRFQERRIQHDTLVWHDGLREWQPLERMTEQLGLEHVRPHTPHPPPLPGSAPPPTTPPSIATVPRTASSGKYARAPLRQKKTLSTGAIALILAGVLGIPALLLFGSLTLSSYRDYAVRSDRIGTLVGLSRGLKDLVATYALRTGHCPANDNPRVAQMRSEVRRQTSVDMRFGDLDHGCMFELAIKADGQPIDGRTLRFEGHPDGSAFIWDCSGGTLLPPDRPAECRAAR